jgi:hypothetical protein
VDRPVNGIINQLGFIPPDLMLDGVEISCRIALSQARSALPEIGGRPCITSSDAHFRKDIGRAYTILRMAAPTVSEIGLALRGEGGRKVVV